LTTKMPNIMQQSF